MDTWYRYRGAWSARPPLALLALLGAVMVVLGIVGTIVTSMLALLFIPGLIVLFGHHLLVNKLD